MTITNRVQGAFFDQEPHSDDAKLIRLAPNAPPSKGPTRRQGRPWTNEEHDKFLQAMEMYPSGPWKDIAAHVGTRTTRQTMTHAQKYRQKIERWKRGASIKTAEMPSPPPSPPVLEQEESGEEAMFWQMLEDILEVEDEDQFQASMASLLNDCQPVAFTTDLLSHNQAYSFAPQDMSYFFEELVEFR